jgi:hypothetical protein
MKNKLLALVAILSILSACQFDKAVKSHTVTELESNENNKLQLPTEEKPDILTLCKQLAEMDKAAIEKRLQKKGLGLFEASYSFYFLGSQYMANNEFDKGIKYQQVAADIYLNPMAMHNLAVIYSKTAEEIKKDLPEGQAKNFKQDFGKTYYYLHRALNSAVLTMENFNDRTAVDDVNRYAAPLITMFEQRDSAILRNFDFAAAEQKGAEDMKLIATQFKKMYNRKEGK